MWPGLYGPHGQLDGLCAAFQERLRTSTALPESSQARGEPGTAHAQVRRAVSNFTSWLRGTHRSVSGEHLQGYLEEFTFGNNRRETPMVSFQRLLGLESHHAPTTLRQITNEGPSAAKRN